MFSQWFSNKPNNRVGFDDVLYAIQNNDRHILLNTLPSVEQQCLISGTIAMENEESMMNSLIKNNRHMQIILLYGKNACDTTPDEKYTQLTKLGFTEVYIYNGGLFEWLLLQDIYGNEFKTTSNIRDPIQYRPKPILKTPLLMPC